MDFSQFALPKPAKGRKARQAKHAYGWWFSGQPDKPPAVVVFDDGREVCSKTKDGRREYKRRIEIMWQRQHRRCCLCAREFVLDAMTFEHEAGRGMGGAKRNDAITKDGKWLNGAACWRCNGKKGSTRMPYLITQDTAHLYKA